MNNFELNSTNFHLFHRIEGIEIIFLFFGHENDKEAVKNGGDMCTKWKKCCDGFS